ncbi:unnamed protein product, partial [Medioppia subpectinata]
MPIDLYFAELSPPARAVLMTLKHLKLDVNVINMDLQKQEQLSPEFLKLNPQHAVPTIVDEGFALGESRAIMQYLVSKYAPNSALYPTHDLKKRANVDRLLYYDMSIWYAIRDVVMMKLFRGDDPHPNAVKNFHNNFTVLNNFIGDNKYVAGNELTIADISYLATLTPLSIKDYEQLDDFPNVKNWFFRVQKELPYFEEVNGKIPQLFKQLAAAKNLSPPCRAVLMTAKHLNIDVNIKNIDMAKGEHMTPEYLKLNPTHKVPTIVDDELVLFESRAIMQYLCNKYAPNDSLYPSDPKQRALVDRWLNTDLSYFLAAADVLVC